MYQKNIKTDKEMFTKWQELLFIIVCKSKLIQKDIAVCRTIYLDFYCHSHQATEDL